ncbi:M20/M25/M40 family metallo-hydrolase [Actinoallomurus sp. NPDC052274]|uniref:M20/M25/M40 family metallo-hydrolase n=1 Tax=Actinoallomurus sp. NPDC052274 TaxID=3155420 RepID=UPI0034431F83
MRTEESPRQDDPITEEYAVDLLRRMLEIPSPSYEEGALAEFLVERMRGLGFSAYVDEAGNAIGEIVYGDGPTVMLLGHMDTVPGEVPVRLEGGRLYGRGSSDAKGPLAAMICAAARVTDLPGRVVVVGAVEEETALSRGAMKIRESLPAPDALIIGEPSGWSTVVLGYKGKLDLRYEVECEPMHPTRPLPKAAELAGRCWATLLDLLGPDVGHDSFDRPGADLISFSGDLLRADAEFSIRTPPGFDAEEFVERLRARTPHGRLTVINSVAAHRVGRTDPVVRALSAGIRAHGVRPGAKLKTATADLNILAEEWHVPMATYGPGDSELDHSAHESTEVADYLRAISVLTTALYRLADGPAGDREPARPLPLRRPADDAAGTDDGSGQTDGTSGKDDPRGLTELEDRAARIRERIIEMCTGRSGGHLGGSMSLVEILVTLYSRVLRIDPDDPEAPDRDVMILSKGHGAIGLYATLGEYGFFPAERLGDYGKPGSPFMAHPNTRLPGVEVPSGALGHGLPLAIGFTLAARLDGADRRTVVLMGDGELQEGSVWEGAMAASSLGLDRLTAVIDRNRLQITGGTEDVVGLEPLADRWRSFGWTAREVDGHDLGALLDALTAPPEPGRPTVVIARTVKGRGLPYIEGDVRSHFVKFSDRQQRRALTTLQKATRKEEA